MSGAATKAGRAGEVFAAFLVLGLTSFGGPVAHIGYFRTEFVGKRAWLSDADYADLVALCQFLPGPASSQVGIALGQMRAGYVGALLAWLAFTLPSALLMLALALGLSAWGAGVPNGVLQGLKLAALAVVAQAVWGMGRSLVPDTGRFLVMTTAAIAVLLLPTGLTQLAVIGLALLLGSLWGGAAAPATIATTAATPPAGLAWIWLVAFAAGLLALPLLAAALHWPALDVLDRLYRTGALVFGGGHVVLPLLQAELVDTGLLDRDTFLAGYGAAQALPGPLFAFAAYAGALLHDPPNGLWGGLLALLAIYLPAAFLVLGALPYWQALRQSPRLRGGLDVANAAVVGLLLAALYDPVFTSAVAGPDHAALALTAYAALTALRLPPWLVVAACAATGATGMLG